MISSGAQNFIAAQSPGLDFAAVADFGDRVARTHGHCRGITGHVAAAHRHFKDRGSGHQDIAHALWSQAIGRSRQQGVAQALDGGDVDAIEAQGVERCEMFQGAAVARERSRMAIGFFCQPVGGDAAEERDVGGRHVFAAGDLDGRRV